jgi:hypothetical protein
MIVVCPYCRLKLRLEPRDFPLTSCGVRYETIEEMRAHRATPANREALARSAAEFAADQADPFHMLGVPADRQAEIVAAVEAQGKHLGDWIADLTTSWGIPPCGGCSSRKAWLNRAHALLEAKCAALFRQSATTPYRT